MYFDDQECPPCRSDGPHSPPWHGGTDGRGSGRGRARSVGRCPPTLITRRVYAILFGNVIQGAQGGLEAEIVGHACASLRHGTRQ